MSYNEEDWDQFPTVDCQSLKEFQNSSGFCRKVYDKCCSDHHRHYRPRSEEQRNPRNCFSSIQQTEKNVNSIVKKLLSNKIFNGDPRRKVFNPAKIPLNISFNPRIYDLIGECPKTREDDDCALSTIEAEDVRSWGPCHEAKRKHFNEKMSSAKTSHQTQCCSNSHNPRICHKTDPSCSNQNIRDRSRNSCRDLKASQVASLIKSLDHEERRKLALDILCELENGEDSPPELCCSHDANDEKSCLSRKITQLERELFQRENSRMFDENNMNGCPNESKEYRDRLIRNENEMIERLRIRLEDLKLEYRVMNSQSHRRTSADHHCPCSSREGTICFIQETNYDFCVGKDGQLTLLRTTGSIQPCEGHCSGEKPIVKLNIC